jgi:hypothetical protein
MAHMHSLSPKTEQENTEDIFTVTQQHTRENVIMAERIYFVLLGSN